MNSPSEMAMWRLLDQRIQTKLERLERVRSILPMSRGTGGLERPDTHTAHVSIIDQDGNAVSLTSSVGSIFASGITLPRSGFMLNNTLADFSPEEGSLNAPAPLKRPLSNMSPLFVYDRSHHHSLIGVMGAAGGSLIPSGIVDFVRHYYFENLTAEESILSPRVHSVDAVDVSIERHTKLDLRQLEHMGYHVGPTDTIWAVFEGIVRKSADQKWEAVADTRYDGLGISTFH